MLTTTTVNVGTEWTSVASGICIVQFNDAMLAVVTEGNTPSTDVGFTVEAKEFYKSGSNRTTVWAKKLLGGTNIESIRVTRYT